MKKRIFFISILTAIFLFNSAEAQIREIDKQNDNYFEISKNLEIFSNIFKVLNQSYVDAIEPGKMTKDAIDAMLFKLDPYTNYFTETDKEDYESMTTGKYGGIGISLMMLDSNIYIGEVFENGPVHKEGIKAGDQILKISDINVTGKSEDELSLLLRGAPGTNVDLLLKNANTKENYKKSITRASVEIGSVPYYALVGPDKNIAYVYLNQFILNASQEVKSALVDLKNQQPNLKGVILDLRGNPGGLLHEAVNICNLFIPKNQLIVSMKGRVPMYSKEFYTESEPWDTQIPVTVLVNSSSASASEVVAGALQDLDRAVIIGTKSFGKGLVQNISPLGYNTSLKITTAKYYTPSGRCIQAVDYSHRNPDGSASSLPDSLKNSFKTRAGRLVYDGGGIDPDITTKEMAVNHTLIALLVDGQIFNYATSYYYNHPKIESADKFKISDKDFNDFLSYIEKRQYHSKSNSEVLLDEFEAVLKKEHNYEENKRTLEELKTRIEQGKEKNLMKSKEEIKILLSNEIVSRYYYQKGRVMNRLNQNDNDMETAIQTLLNKEGQYTKILSK